MKLEDLKIIVTGGAQGMGRHFALRLAEAGAQVAVGDVNEVGLAETLEAGKTGGQGEDPRAPARRRRRGRRRLVRRVGARRDGRPQRPRQQRRHPARRPAREEGPRDRRGRRRSRKEQWDAVIGVNLTGATLITRDVVAKMVETEPAPRRHREHLEHRAPRQPRPVELHGREGRARGEHRHLVEGVRGRSASASARSPRA